MLIVVKAQGPDQVIVQEAQDLGTRPGQFEILNLLISSSKSNTSIQLEFETLMMIEAATHLLLCSDGIAYSKGMYAMYCWNQ